MGNKDARRLMSGRVVLKGDKRFPRTTHGKRWLTYEMAGSYNKASHGRWDGRETTFLMGYHVHMFMGRELRMSSDLVVDDRMVGIIARISRLM